jgi:hypothetical protein
MRHDAITAVRNVHLKFVQTVTLNRGTRRFTTLQDRVFSASTFPCLSLSSSLSFSLSLSSLLPAQSNDEGPIAS